MMHLPSVDDHHVVILDAGFSTQLSKYVGDRVDGQPLWTASFLLTNPDDVFQTHLDFLRSGADCISTNTYQASIDGYNKYLNLTAEQSLELMARAVELAQRARDVYTEENRDTCVPLIAGSVGPYGAHLNDGSEYTGAYADTIPTEVIKEWHRPRMKTLIDAGVDLLAIETIPCLKEAEALCHLLKEYPNTRAWMSFSCKEKCLAHGEPFQEVAKKCISMNGSQMLGVGVNCCEPAMVAQLFEGFYDSNNCKTPLVCYPNSGEGYSREQGWQGHCQPLHTFVHEWLNAGVRYVGGCCRTSLQDITHIRDKRIFGVSVSKDVQSRSLHLALNQNAQLKELNEQLAAEIRGLKAQLGKQQDEHFSYYLCLMKERDARYTLYFDNLKLQLQLKELDGSGQPVDHACGDPYVLRIALDRCRERLAETNKELCTMKVEYEDTVPRRTHQALESEHWHMREAIDNLKEEHRTLQHKCDKLTALKCGMEEELGELRERCDELEREGTPRPQWALCGDALGLGRERWARLAHEHTSRELLTILLGQLGEHSAADHFRGLGNDPAIPPYLRYEGSVRNLRLSRRDINVLINDIWTARMDHQGDVTMQDFLTKYFEDRYQQRAVRAEWAYNLCSGAEQMLDEPQVKLFWGVLHGQLSIDMYIMHKEQWHKFKENLYAKGRETLTMDELERIAKSTFPLKSDVDIKNISEVVRRQLKMKVAHNDINLDKLFREGEEGFTRLELSQELFRQRRREQERYLRELLAELGAKHRGKPVTVHGLQRAFAIVDPAIDHIRMEKNIRWVYSAGGGGPLPLSVVAVRLAATDIARAGPRHRTHTNRRTTHHRI